MPLPENPTPMQLPYNTYIGSRYVPIFAGEWDSSRTYEPLTIVQYQGSSYTSRTFVPAGTAITNTTYWVNTGNYNAQVEQYRQEVLRYISEVEAYDQRITDNANHISTIYNDISNLSSSVNNINTQIEPWTKNKTMLVIGDSISAQNYGWQTKLNNLQLASVTAPNVGGEVFATHIRKTGWCENIVNYRDRYDITVTFLGTNDWSNNAPLGTPSDPVNTYGTYLGAIRTYFSRLVFYSPNARHFCVLPLKRTDQTEVGEYQSLDHGIYRLLLKLYCENSNIHVIDPYTVFGMNPDTSLYPQYWEDKVHPTEAGHTLIAEYISKHILYDIVDRSPTVSRMVASRGYNSPLIPNESVAIGNSYIYTTETRTYFKLSLSGVDLTNATLRQNLAEFNMLIGSAYGIELVECIQYSASTGAVKQLQAILDGTTLKILGDDHTETAATVFFSASYNSPIHTPFYN